jgi:arginase
VEAVLDVGEFPVVLGSMLALRRRGRYGLLFIDGNADFFQPEAEPNGEGASMDLAFVTGYGPTLLTDIEGRRPLVRPEDTVAFAFRDHEDQAEFGSQPLPAELLAYDLHTVRRLGVEAGARAAVFHLTRAELDGFFIHLDADAVDDAVTPAVDFRIPGGLSWDELAMVLRIGLASGKAVGLEVPFTIRGWMRTAAPVADWLMCWLQRSRARVRGIDFSIVEIRAVLNPRAEGRFGQINALDMSHTG